MGPDAIGSKHITQLQYVKYLCSFLFLIITAFKKHIKRDIADISPKYQKNPAHPTSTAKHLFASVIFSNS